MEIHRPKPGVCPKTRTIAQLSQSERGASDGQPRCASLKSSHVQDRTKKAHDPIKVDSPEPYASAAELCEPNPRAGQTVKPMPPIRFQKPMCHPSILGAGLYLFGSVSLSSRESIFKSASPLTSS
jgi:hypothetical protein